uniref:Sulfhydryl oxidase n=1 Tax=Setaria digitata TaxID=48799 RepID=A0A915PU61_9BILA
MFLLLNAFLNIFGRFACGEFAFAGRQPIAVNPTLYDPKVDYVVQLDDLTFNDTVFCRQSSDGDGCTAYVVQFYLDWCGHCRTYAQIYKALARDIHGWNKVVRMAAVNCADPLNEVTCQSNDALFFPFLKYFPRNSSSPKYGIPMQTLQSVPEMRDLITQAILLDYSASRHPNWPNFDFLGKIQTYSELWDGVNESTPLLVIIFEEEAESLIGIELLLDMVKYSDRLMARRCLKSHPLADALNIKNFPTMAIFKREQRTPLLVAELRKLLFGELEKFLGNGNNDNQIKVNFIRNRSLCESDIVKCRQRFFASETDMLKAMRYSIFDEVTRSNMDLRGKNLTALRNFLDLLAKTLLNSKRAVNLFGKMRDYLDQKGMENTITAKDYKEKFRNLEEENDNPFPTEADWEHCAGSSPQFRGYTCGLWTAFHALTIQAYKNSVNDPKFAPIAPLVAIRDWVSNFFGCEHCRGHFIRMTTRTFRMESQVHRPEDTFIYLWQAHNIVNARLRGDGTEDPEFPKRQFPPDFLCATCRQEGYFNNDQVKDFLLVYYSAIRPYL